MSHMTRTPLSRSKSQQSSSPGRFTHHGINTSGSCSSDHGNVLSVGTYHYVAVCRHGQLGGVRGFGANRGRRGAGAYSGSRQPAACYYCLSHHTTMEWREGEVADFICLSVYLSLCISTQQDQRWRHQIWYT